MERAGVKKSVKDTAFKITLLVCAGLSAAAILTIILFLIIRSFPAFAEIGVFKFIFGTNWAPTNEALPIEERFGVLPMIAGSIYVTAVALLIAVPIGVLSAVFLVKFCHKKAGRILSGVISVLAGVPSIVYGFFGMVVLVPVLKEFAYMIGISAPTGDGVLAGGIVLAVMIIPTITAISKNALLAVPKNYYEGAIALGGTKEQATFSVVLPAAKRGVAAAVIMAAGRAMGETMAIAMVTGSAAVFPQSLFHSMRTLTSNIVKEMGYAEPFHVSALIATGVVLFVFVLALNLIFKLLTREKKLENKKKGRRRAGGKNEF